MGKYPSQHFLAVIEMHDMICTREGADPAATGYCNFPTIFECAEPLKSKGVEVSFTGTLTVPLILISKVLLMLINSLEQYFSRLGTS